MNLRLDLSTLILFGGLALTWLPWDRFSPDPPPAIPSRVAPAAGLQTLVEPLHQWHSPVVGSAYRDFALVVGRSDLKTTGQLRAAIQRFEAILLAGTPAAGTLPGFSAAANKLLVEQLGADDGALDKAKAAALIDAVGWRLESK